MLTLTGNLGNVMKESASTALSYLKAHADFYNIPVSRFEETNIHIHVPEGAVPKDGPSAGITMLTSLASAFTGKKVKPYLAMTGEITLRGRVLPIGGLKEKLLAALRGGIKKVLIPEENAKDLVDIPDNVKNNMEIIPVSMMSEVIQHALKRQPIPIEWDPTMEATPIAATDDSGATIAH